MPKADATGLAPEKSAEQNPPAPFIGRRRVLLFARPISMVKSQSGGLGHPNATTARRAFQIEFFTALPAKLDGKQSENLGGKDRDPLHNIKRKARIAKRVTIKSYVARNRKRGDWYRSE